MGEYLRQRGVAWTYFRDEPSLRLLEEQPEHGCDLCSRYRRRAVYEIAHGLGANVIAFGHTADDFCEALLRNTMFTGKLSALPPVTTSRNRDYRLIRPLVFVTEDITTRLRRSARRVPVVPCGCSQKTGTVRALAARLFAGLEQRISRISRRTFSPPWEISIPAACWIPRFLDLDGAARTQTDAAELFPILTELNACRVDRPE